MAKKYTGRRWLPFAIGCAFVLGTVVGCGGIKKIPVSGTVTLDGKPLQGGILEFCPDTAKGNAFEVTCTSPVKEGKYELQTLAITGRDSGAGVPPGWYKVILRVPNMMTKRNPQSPVEVNEKFKSIEKTPLEVEVKENPDPGSYDLKMTR
jgi:hypothetical protein